MAVKQWSDAEFGGLPSVAVAAHELKTPLALIRQLSLLLEEGDLSGDEVLQMQRQITHVSEQALKLTTDLARAANLDPTLFPLEPVNLQSVCQQMAQEMQPMAALYSRQIQWPAARSGRLVVANRLLLARILANFLGNALKYTEADVPIKVKITKTNEFVRLSVRDYGPMMSRREYRQLLKTMAARKAVRTRPESSGLGVYVAAQFARAMRGDIGLIRHRDGLTFYVDMPLSRQMSLV